MKVTKTIGIILASLVFTTSCAKNIPVINKPVINKPVITTDYSTHVCYKRDRGECDFYCANGNKQSCFLLAETYQNQYNVDTDYELADGILNKLCYQYKYGIACGKLGNIYDVGLYDRKVNDEKSFLYYKIGCDYGDNLSCADLGTYYAKGRFVNKDNLVSVRLYRKACSIHQKPYLGQASACLNLGVHYMNGDSVIKDEVLGSKLIIKSLFLSTKPMNKNFAAQLMIQLSIPLVAASNKEVNESMHKFANTYIDDEYVSTLLRDRKNLDIPDSINGIRNDLKFYTKFCKSGSIKSCINGVNLVNKLSDKINKMYGNHSNSEKSKELLFYGVYPFYEEMLLMFMQYGCKYGVKKYCSIKHDIESTEIEGYNHMLYEEDHNWNEFKNSHLINTPNDIMEYNK